LMVLAIGFADPLPSRFSYPSHAPPVVEAAPDLCETARLAVVSQHRFLVSHAFGIVANIRKQQGTAPGGFEAAHVAAIGSSHVDGAIQDNFRPTDQLVELASKHRRFGYPGDRRGTRMLLQRQQATDE